MEEERARRIRRALVWISARLEAAGVPFQVAGGLAARAHGATRPLHDIDLYVPEGSLERLRFELAEASRTWYRSGPGDDWHPADVDFEAPVMKEVFGVELPVMPLDRLMTYKRRIGRPVDREDLAEMET
jgi:hypothetical protein